MRTIIRRTSAERSSHDRPRRGSVHKGRCCNAAPEAVSRGKRRENRRPKAPSYRSSIMAILSKIALPRDASDGSPDARPPCKIGQAVCRSRAPDRSARLPEMGAYRYQPTRAECPGTVTGSAPPCGIRPALSAQTGRRDGARCVRRCRTEALNVLFMTWGGKTLELLDLTFPL